MNCHRCRAGWRGVACDRCVPLTGCAHGSCKEPGQCVCERGWTGARCDRDICLCSSKPCFGNSSCLNVGESFICICVAGFTGKNCQLKSTPCSPDGSSCQNGGTCVDSSGSDNSSCICPSGFTGRFCQSNVCDPNPCENDGICSHRDLTFTCVCPPAFSGPVCSFRLCSSVQCINGGTCFNHTDSPIRCVCPPGFTGSSCELHVNKLKVKPRFKSAVPGHTFHRSHRPADRELLKISMKETVGASGSLPTQSQVVCLTILVLLTCLVVLVTSGIIFFHRCETWMANVKYSHLVRQRRDFLLRAGDGEDHTINVIIPEKIKLRNYGQGYTSI
ncbi:protein delta homolog 1 isoform X2 [Triplophysa dalaica]|uniref:protein delta homolog 1 isoform X2 n=1 Tax=Triplophysa dalaica TaxID=1582913 RepID=UPI0024DFFFAB|nr:protein delta homolog 1 isoform X2 [Triplophysa dalaica]